MGVLFGRAAAKKRWQGLVAMRRRLGAPCVHRGPRSARSRRDGFDGVELSRDDSLRLLVQAMSDTPGKIRRDLQCGALLASATRVGTRLSCCDAGTGYTLKLCY